jgi:hypothetical protein
LITVVSRGCGARCQDDDEEDAVEVDDDEVDEDPPPLALEDAEEDPLDEPRESVR